jgi:hypothetical protein
MQFFGSTVERFVEKKSRKEDKMLGPGYYTKQNVSSAQGVKK